MGIFSLLFRKNDIVNEDNNLKIETVETVSNKVEIVYQSSMLFKSLDSYIPNRDIMEIAVPRAMEIFKEEYTVYSTEKLLSSTFSSLQLNLSLRKELYLISTGKSVNVETFKSLAALEIPFLDKTFLSKISKGEIATPTYEKIRVVILDSFKIAGETDPYFNELYKISNSYFKEYSNIDGIVEIISSNILEDKSDVLNESSVFYISSYNSLNATTDLMYIANIKLKNRLSSIYNFNSMSTILSKVIYTLNKITQERLSKYENNISSVDYLIEIKKSVEEVDHFLIEMIENKKMDETSYLTLQEVLAETFLEASVYDLYIEAISTMFNNHIESNIFFKEYISLKVYDIFSDN